MKQKSEMITTLFLFIPHAQVMWVRTDLLKEHNIEVPKTWDQLYEASKN